ncbi:hypothetical protein P154DRAFT_625195 [Amniculicola lignicola CBS 123094]|uniref:DNA/RNA-binding protein Alba-like domain-containing protein n=1 Tax=Amniculicola lignicola CBS 123094 TaxID=1392246 RepID=A0A6A5VYK4_9PLEO|nr:hypothetical protein P154DRAFT_625195 [Amniculicola lignicola CBS 123094]
MGKNKAKKVEKAEKAGKRARGGTNVVAHGAGEIGLGIGDGGEESRVVVAGMSVDGGAATLDVVDKTMVTESEGPTLPILGHTPVLDQTHIHPRPHVPTTKRKRSTDDTEDAQQAAAATLPGRHGMGEIRAGAAQLENKVWNALSRPWEFLRATVRGRMEERLGDAVWEERKEKFVCVIAQGKGTMKMTSVVEIAKRVVGPAANGVVGGDEQGKRWYVYTGLSSRDADEATSGKNKNQRKKKEERNEDASDSEDAFEVLGRHPDGHARKKPKKIPVLMIWLSPVPILELAQEFGEGTMRVAERIYPIPFLPSDIEGIGPSGGGHYASHSMDQAMSEEETTDGIPFSGYQTTCLELQQAIEGKRK